MISAIIPFVFSEDPESDNYREEFFLLEKPAVRCLTYPVKLNFTIGIVCLKGQVKGLSNMRYFETEAPCMIVLLAGHTVTIASVSDDFSALFIIMSNKFTASLNIEERLPVFLSLHNSPVIPLNKKELKGFKNYFKMVRKVLREVHNPFCIKIIQHFTTAYFYALGYNFHQIEQHNKDVKKPRQKELLDKFLSDVQDNFKTEREIKFYADKLYVTPKYLSKVIRNNSGLSAKQWIDDYVVWESKALLKSTNMTIQQISDGLNFPSQSFFGKYFKRSVGLSPLEYRKH